MQRGANNDDTRGMELEDRVQDEMMSDLPMDSSFRGLSDHEFNLAAMSQEVPSTFENTTFRSAPIVAMDAQPARLESVQRMKDMQKPALVQRSVTPAKPEVQATAAPAAFNTAADSDLARRVAVGPVPPLPFELERVTVIRKEFASSEHAALAVMGALRETGVDFSAEPEAAKWRCAHCCAAAYISFTIQLFLAAGEYVIEIQRRSGEGCAFMALYRQLKGQLTGKAVQSRPANFGLLAPTLPPSLLEKVSEPEMDPVEEVSLALDLLKSDYLDMQKEGAQCISEMTSDQATRDRVASSTEALGLLVTAVATFLATTVDVQSRSYAAFALANLTEAVPCRDMLTSAPGLVHVLHTLAGFVHNGSYEDVQMRREAARALANIAATHKDAMARVLGQDVIRDFVGDARELHDPVVRNYVSSACGQFTLETKA